MQHQQYQPHENPYQAYGTAVVPAAHAEVNARADFIRKTYLNLGLAVLGFTGCCAGLIASGAAESLVRMIVTVPYGQFLFFIGFVGVAWLAESWAHRTVSIGQQYAALTLYVVAESLFFAPMLYYLHTFEEATGPIIGPAAIITLFIFFGLTAIVFYTAKDFSWLRGILGIGSMAALGLMLAGWIFGFSLGIFFTVAMIALAAGYILYYTSAVMRDYPTTHYVAAALTLFASLALLFWYVLRLLSYLQSD
ncbi:MAG: Bax inhibitor-1 family protein [Pirellulales bacterium]|nr:Bax inhibitor-1 family protein [Pirellulales bacterium]